MKTALLGTIAAAAIGLGAAGSAQALTITEDLEITLGSPSEFIFYAFNDAEYDVVTDPSVPSMVFTVTDMADVMVPGGLGDTYLYDLALTAGLYKLTLLSNSFSGWVELTITDDIDLNPPAIPLPASGPLLGLALGAAGLFALRRRKGRAA